MGVSNDPNEAQGNSGPLFSVTVAGQKLTPVTDGTIDQKANAVNNSATNAWYHNESINITFIKVFDNSSSITIQAQYV